MSKFDHPITALLAAWATVIVLLWLAIGSGGCTQKSCPIMAVKSVQVQDAVSCFDATSIVCDPQSDDVVFRLWAFNEQGGCTGCHIVYEKRTSGNSVSPDWCSICERDRILIPDAYSITADNLTSESVFVKTPPTKVECW